MDEIFVQIFTQYSLKESISVPFSPVNIIDKYHKNQEFIRVISGYRNPLEVMIAGTVTQLVILTPSCAGRIAMACILG